MPKEFSRTRRVGEQIQRELSALIREEVGDPRVGMVTINAVEVSRDLGHAKVFVTQLHFHYDESVVRGARLSALIDEAVADDRKKHEDDNDER